MARAWWARILPAVLAAGLMSAVGGDSCLAQAEAALPPGVKAVWNLDQAWREKTPTRERVCLNGLWRWQPAQGTDETVPAGGWGYFKVPGCWPGITDYLQKDCQTVYPHPAWKDKRLGQVAAAWYQRELTVPADWAGRRISLRADYVNSYAVVYVDGQRAGEIRFPGGEVDLTSACRPGRRCVVSLLVVAMPLKGVMLSYSNTATAREVKGSVERRGLCGDVYLVGEPAGPRLREVQISTSVRRWEIKFAAGVEELAADGSYALRVRIKDGGRQVAEFTSPASRGADLKEGRLEFAAKWKPEKLWDINTPQNTYEASVSLLGPGGQVVDTAWPARFGFRELWIDGRDFYLNGSRLFISSVPVDNAQIGAAWASYAGARETLERLKSFGINMVYTHNYGCEPGTHLSFEEILRAADDVGMLVSFSQPHFGQYDWKAPDADRTNGYARHAAFYVRAAGNHPSVNFYSMSHNATGYDEDMNPDLLGAEPAPRDRSALNNAALALRAEAIVRGLDPSRIVYHHASGNLGAMDTINFYPNFAPIQELSEWFEHWAGQGVKPLFTCEYGAPFTWDWSMYRGWYKGQREFGSAAVQWEFCFAEWNAQFLGDRAFRLGEAEKANLRWEDRQFRAGRVWYRWDYPYEIGSRVFADRQEVLARYLTANWRAYRTWGVSAISPWEYGHFWQLRDGVDRRRKNLKTDWENLQRPGFSADYIDGQDDCMAVAFERSDWTPTAAGQALLRNNRPLLAYIGGRPARFTSQDHNFRPGETVEKQIILLNNSRQPVSCDCQWSWAAPGATQVGRKSVTVQTGEQEHVPLRLEVPKTLAPGRYELTMSAAFAGGETQTDSFAVDVLPARAASKPAGRIALFDPAGETAKRLAERHVPCEMVAPTADLAPYDVLIIGKAALTAGGAAPDVRRVRDGLKVIVFEQTAEALEQRLGFRVAQYGLRQVFKRVPDHPLLAGLEAANLCDWRGEATLLPPRLKYVERPMHGPTIKWCDINVSQVWRCGCQGNVASVLIEKPARGDFLPIVDGGFSLQYSPLLEYHEGRGLILFCQMDVTGRTEDDPAADLLLGNIIDYVSAWKPAAAARQAVYVGEAAGKSYFEKLGLQVRSYEGGPPATGQLVIVGPGGGAALAASKGMLGEWLGAGGRLLAVGLDEREAAAFLPFKVTMKKAEHISTFFDPPGIKSPLAGVGPADVHNRAPRQLPLVSAGATATGDGVLAEAEQGHVVLCQLAPWQFDYDKQYNLKRTYRRASFLVNRLLANLGAAGSTPLLERLHSPVPDGKGEKRWSAGFYLDQPEEMDDPYRFFRW